MAFVRSGKDVFSFISVFALLYKTQVRENTSFYLVRRVNYETLF